MSTQRPPLAVRLTPRFIREPLRRIVREHILSVVHSALAPSSEQVDPHLVRALEHRIAHSASVDGKHLPIKPGVEHYVLPIVGRADAASPDGMPIPDKDLWVGYADTADRYLEIGRLNIQKMRSILTAPNAAGEPGRDIQRGDRILDFGCAAGPQIRCLRSFAEGENPCEVWGVDISAPHVSWCMLNLPTCFRFAVTTASPHLPFEDRSFDLIYCGSVFSHLSEMTDAWLLELSRIIRPGGRLYLTLNTKRSMHMYLKWWPELEFSEMVRAAMPDPEPWKQNFAEAVVGRSVWQHSVFNLKHFQRKCDQANFRVVSETKDAYSFQTGLLLERLETRRHTPPPFQTAHAHVVVSSGPALRAEKTSA